MNLKQRLLKPYVNIGKRLFGVGREDDFFALTQKWGSNYDLYGLLDYYEKTVYNCVNLIADEVGTYKPQLFVQRGDNLEQLASHPILDLLDNPQPDDEAGIGRFELFEATQSFIELHGECFWYMVRGRLTGIPRAIYILRPDKMGVDIDGNGNINGYYLRRNTGSPVPFEVEEIVHHKLFNPKNPYRGYSPLQAAMDYIQSEGSASKFTRNFFDNNAGLNGVLSIKGEVSQNAFAKFVRQWRQKYEGVDNAGKTAIVRETDTSFTKVGLGLNELNMEVLRKMSKEDVAESFRVPLPLLGKSEQTGLGRAEIEALEYIFAKRTIEPKLKRLDSKLQKAAARYFPDQNLIIQHENTVPADKVHALAVRDKAVDRWLTRNEIRGEDGLEAVGGADELRAPIASIPLSLPPIEPEEEKKKEKSVIRLKLKKKLKTTDQPLNSENKEQFRLRLMQNQEAYERQFKQALLPVIEAQETEALNNLEAVSSKEYTEPIIDDKEADANFLAALLPVLISLLTVQGALALLFAGVEDQEFDLSEAIQRDVRESVSKMAANFNDETLAKLNQTLAEGIREGEGLSKMKRRIKEVYTEAKGYRLERIARTETLKASNNATELAYRQTGYVKGRKWYANPGHCTICGAMEGRVANLGVPFLELGQKVTYTDENGNEKDYAIDYDDVANPPLHPNCRCTVIPII